MNKVNIQNINYLMFMQFNTSILFFQRKFAQTFCGNNREIFYLFNAVSLNKVEFDVN